jgi:hypothetical protein
MNSVLGNHIGLVVNNQDPEGRSRLQIFIPHLSNTIYKSWNESLQDVSFKTFSEDLFTGELKETILSTLPWAEAAVPIWGGGTGAPVYSDGGEPTPIPTDQNLDVESEEEPLPPVGGDIAPFPSQGGPFAPVEPDLPTEGGAVDVPPDNLPPDQMPMWDESPDNREIEVDSGINNSEGRFSGEVESLGSGGIPQDSQGLIDPDQMYNGVLNIIKNNPNSIYNRTDAPINGERYGITGGAESWANFWKRTGSYESSYNNNTTNRSDPGGSFGILQVGPAQINSWANVNNNQDLARSYGLDPNRNYTEQDILASADLAVRAKLFVGDAIMRSSTYGGYRVGAGENNGLGATLGSATWKKLENGSPLAQGSSSSSQNVIRTTAMGVNAVGSINGSRPGGPMGIFSTPHIGAKVWVFFLGGNAQRPVYFANVYEPSNVATVV